MEKGSPLVIRYDTRPEMVSADKTATTTQKLDPLGRDRLAGKIQNQGKTAKSEVRACCF
jgi:hypothetical protein